MFRRPQCFSHKNKRVFYRITKSTRQKESKFSNSDVDFTYNFVENNLEFIFFSHGHMWLLMRPSQRHIVMTIKWSFQCNSMFFFCFCSWRPLQKLDIHSASIIIREVFIKKKALDHNNNIVNGNQIANPKLVLFINCIDLGWCLMIILIIAPHIWIIMREELNILLTYFCYSSESRFESD